MIPIVNTKFDDVPENKLYKTVSNNFWFPIKEIEDAIVCYYNKNNMKSCLDIGADLYSFPISTEQINCKKCDKPTIVMDIDTDIIPRPDNTYDFGYSRHTFEDIQNPDFAFKEFTRVCTEGYIETPSPLVECMKGTDCITGNHRGYIHHRYIVWTDISDNSIHFLPKFPIIEHLTFTEKFHNTMLVLANEYGTYWNNYYMWNKDRPPKCIIYKHGINFFIQKDYANLLVNAIYKTIEASNYFVQNFLENNK